MRSIVSVTEAGLRLCIATAGATSATGTLYDAGTLIRKIENGFDVVGFDRRVAAACLHRNHGLALGISARRSRAAGSRRRSEPRSAARTARPRRSDWWRSESTPSPRSRARARGV